MADGTFEPSWKAEALRLFANRPLWIGVASGIRRPEGVITSIDEETDPAYARQPITFSEPMELGQGGIEIVNVETVRFPPYARDAARAMAWWFIVDEPVGGDVKASGEFTPRDRRLPRLEEGDELVIRQGDLRLIYP